MGKSSWRALQGHGSPKERAAGKQDPAEQEQIPLRAQPGPQELLAALNAFLIERFASGNSSQTSKVCSV